MRVFGFIVLVICILITLSFTLRIRAKVKNEQAREKAMELQAFLMTASIVSIYLFSFSPFHLLWMMPASFILGLISMTTPLKVLWLFSSIYFSIWYIGVANQGRGEYMDGNYEVAIDEFKKQIKRKPSAEAYFNLGLAYAKMEDTENEIHSYLESIALDSRKPESQFNLGIAYAKNEQNQKAIDAINQAIKLRPNYLKAHYWACKIYAEIGDLDNAKREFEEVYKIDQSSAHELTDIVNIA